MVTKKKPQKFKSAGVYCKKEPASFHYLSEKKTFWIALMSLFMFVTGNMLGQNGWHVFWKSVLGNSLETTIVYTGTVSPIAKIPDYARWAKLGGDVRKHTYRAVPQDYLIPLPSYQGPEKSDPTIYMVDQLATYSTGRGEGSHPGVDISIPDGTPIVSIANGIVYRAGNDVGGYGNFVVVKHPRVPDPEQSSKTTTLYSVYAHLESVLVEDGDLVTKGQQIGASGHTGFATGPHLHFQIDRDEAPWHPYWPFTGSEARQAGLSMSKAVDAGLNRANGLLYTVHPMLYVQGHLSDSPQTIAKAPSASAKATASTARLSIEDRRKQRMAKLGITSTAIVAVNDAVLPAPAPAASASASSATVDVEPAAAPVPAPAPKPADTNVVSVSVRHDGSFSADRMRETVTLELLDENGSVVARPTGDGRIDLRTAFGSAEFFPRFVKFSDFKDGVAKVQMLPLGQRTVVIVVQPYGNMSRPMEFER